MPDSSRDQPLPVKRHSRWAWAALPVASVAILFGAGLALSGGSAGSHPARAPRAQQPTAQGPPQAPVTNVALSSVKRVSGTGLLDGGKPVLFFMGAHFCPFCAAERWALVRATSRFGTWTGLRPLHSQGGSDGFASLPTYDLVNATYTSSLLSLRHKEVADVAGKRLQSLAGIETTLVNAYDSGGSIPFIAAGAAAGQFTVQLAYSPSLIAGQTFDGLRQALAANAATPTVRAISDEADAITALLCKLTGGQPAGVCSSNSISALGKQLA